MQEERDSRREDCEGNEQGYGKSGVVPVGVAAAMKADALLPHALEGDRVCKQIVLHSSRHTRW